MATVKSFLCAICFAAAFGSGLPGRNIVKEGRDYGRNEGASAVVSAAQQEIGIREDSENAGKRVDQYNAYVGFRKAPWCAAFCSWVFGQAGYPEPRTAWSPALFPERRLRTEPLPAMILGIYFPSLKRIGHCGIVESVRNDWVISIEGNTNVAGSREGDGVYRKWRHRRSIRYFADWIQKPLLR